MTEKPSERTTQKRSRRGFLKKATYVGPLILTLKVTAADAATGSGSSKPRGRGRGNRCGKRRRGWLR
jgi:hypothetical protein